jgi:hypothetical protein
MIGIVCTGSCVHSKIISREFCAIKSNYIVIFLLLKFLSNTCDNENQIIRKSEKNYAVLGWKVSLVKSVCVWFRFMVFNATFSNISVISWWSVLLMEETEVPGENH